VLGIIVYVIEQGKLGEVVLDRALQATVHFNAQAGYLLDTPGLPDHQGFDRELQAFVSRSLKLRKSRLGRIGYSVFIRIFDPDRIEVAKYIDSNYVDIETVETHMGSSELWIPRDDEDWYEISRVHGTQYIKVCVPLRNSSGEVVAYAEGMFTVSSEAKADSRRKALRTALIVIAIVFITTILLYPVIIKLMNELKNTQLQLIQAEKLESIGRLAAGVAHEVKNPLAVIQLGIDFLSNVMNKSKDVADSVQEMDDAVKRADKVIKGLLEFSRPSKPEMASHDINIILEDSLLLVKYELTKNNISLEKQLNKELPKIELDRNKIKQVFINIFMNAIHAMGKDGMLTVRTSLSQLSKELYNLHCKQTEHFKIGNNVVFVEIKDTGTGIPKDKLDKLFDPFFTTKPIGVGTGLGLSVTRKIVDLHKSAISIMNRKEGGALVTIIFRT